MNQNRIQFSMVLILLRLCQIHGKKKYKIENQIHLKYKKYLLVWMVWDINIKRRCKLQWNIQRDHFYLFFFYFFIHTQEQTVSKAIVFQLHVYVSAIVCSTLSLKSKKKKQNSHRLPNRTFNSRKVLHIKYSKKRNETNFTFHLIFNSVQKQNKKHFALLQVNRFCFLHFLISLDHELVIILAFPFHQPIQWFGAEIYYCFDKFFDFFFLQKQKCSSFTYIISSPKYRQLVFYHRSTTAAKNF